MDTRAENSLIWHHLLTHLRIIQIQITSIWPFTRANKGGRGLSLSDAALLFLLLRAEKENNKLNKAERWSFKIGNCIHNTLLPCNYPIHLMFNFVEQRWIHNHFIEMSTATMALFLFHYSSHFKYYLIFAVVHTDTYKIYRDIRKCFITILHSSASALGNNSAGLIY